LGLPLLLKKLSLQGMKGGGYETGRCRYFLCYRLGGHCGAKSRKRTAAGRDQRGQILATNYQQLARAALSSGMELQVHLSEEQLR